jgi:hypothetical protein
VFLDVGIRARVTVGGSIVKRGKGPLPGLKDTPAGPVVEDV